MLHVLLSSGLGELCSLFPSPGALAAVVPLTSIPTGTTIWVAPDQEGEDVSDPTDGWVPTQANRKMKTA